MAITPGQAIFQGRARLFRLLRDTIKGLLYPTPSLGGGTPTPQDKTNQILNDFLNSFSRFAGNQPTAFDNGAGLSAASTNGNVLELKVERAFTMVLGRAVGGLGSTNNFIKALNAAFPTTPDGIVVDTPQRGVIPLYSSNGSSNPSGNNIFGGYSSGINPYSNSVMDGLVGQLSTKQATLFREASIVAGDALKILAGLETFMPEADKEEVEALRALIRSVINTLVEEFGRVDEPRETRVEAYLNALDSNLIQLGSRGFLDNPLLVTTIGDETQTAGFELLTNYASTLRSTWNAFNTSVRIPPIKSLSLQVERANVVLPIIAQGNVDFQAALGSVAFTESEQRSRAAEFTTLDGKLIPHIPAIFNLGLDLPDVTVRDLVDWLDRFANVEGPTMLADSGQFGLEFVLDEADLLFWTIVPVIGILEFLDSTNSTSRPMLRQILSNERVRWSLDNLLDQLKALADLAA